jgi:hypothetical protein
VASRYFIVAAFPMLMIGSACGADLLSVSGPETAGVMAQQVTTLGQTVTLHVGETASLRAESLQVHFDKVAEDSRCPVGVTCVWEGDAVIHLTVTKDGSTVLELHTQANFPREGVYAGYRVRLAELSPLPKANRPADPARYVASLVITRTS